MAGILEGIRVLDWTIYQQGPVVGMILGDLGADVIKIEEKDVGDPARGMGRVAGAMLSNEGLVGLNSYWEAGNRNKRAISLDLRNAKGKEVAYELVKKSDVFVQNFREGVAERMEMDYKTLSKHNPRLIYCHSSAWGPKGPDRGDPSADYTGVARSGLMYTAGEPDAGPQMVQGGIGDQTGATMSALGILAALLHRERTGEGQELEASLLGGLTFLMGHVVTMRLISRIPGIRIPRTKAGNPLWNHYKCADDTWIALAHLSPDKFWPNVCTALGIKDLEKDPRFESMEARTQHKEELITIFDRIFATKPRQEWIDSFKANNVIYGLLNDITDLENDPQILENDYITTYDHPAFGQIRTVGHPITFSKTPMSVRRAAPEFGQHTEEVLMEVLGYTWDDLTKLKDEGVY